MAIAGAFSEHDLYQRNRVLAEQARACFRDHLEIRSEASDDATNPFAPGKAGLGARVRAVLRNVRTMIASRHALKSCDVIYVPYPAYTTLLVLWCLGVLRGARLVVADAFIELPSTLVDRRILRGGSLRLRLLTWLETFSLSRADCVLIDTKEQAALLRGRLATTGTRVIAVPVGIDETQWTPLPAPAVTGRIRVLFWGTFIPLHGIPTIVDAVQHLASRDPGIEFCLVGDGQEADNLEQCLRGGAPASLNWRRELLATAELREEIAHCHLVLGIFGESSKAGAVVPYKVQQALASNRPVITRESPAIDPFADGAAGLLTVPPGNAMALARAIEQLASRLREGWTAATRDIYDRHFSAPIVREAFREAFEDPRRPH